MAVTDLLAAQRPQRVDARRNFDALLAAGRAVFTEHGTEASLEEVARRAGVGIGTLYRHFPTRQALIESVYVAEVDALCRFGDGLADVEPWEALVAWLHRFVTYLGAKRALMDGLNRESGAFVACREALHQSGGPLLARAQAVGAARSEASIDDVLRFVIAITAVEYASSDQRERVLEMAVAGIRA